MYWQSYPGLHLTNCCAGWFLFFHTLWYFAQRDYLLNRLLTRYFAPRATCPYEQQRSRDANRNMSVESNYFCTYKPSEDLLDAIFRILLIWKAQHAWMKTVTHIDSNLRTIVTFEHTKWSFCSETRRKMPTTAISTEIGSARFARFRLKYYNGAPKMCNIIMSTQTRDTVILPQIEPQHHKRDEQVPHHHDQVSKKDGPSAVCV